MQTFYCYIIGNNKEKTDETQSAIYCHMIIGPEQQINVKQRQFCPKPPDPWCKYQVYQMVKTSNYDRKKCLASVFREELKHIFDRFFL